MKQRRSPKKETQPSTPNRLMTSLNSHSSSSSNKLAAAATEIVPPNLFGHEDRRRPSTTAARVRLSFQTSSRGDVSLSGQPSDRTPVTTADDDDDDNHSDALNYALLIALYTLQGIPMGLSASIPFLIQQKTRLLAQSNAHQLAAAAAATAATALANSSSSSSSMMARMAQESAAARLSYNANAIFALCSWPFSLKLLWAPIVDACFVRSLGRRKSWIVPVQAMAGVLMVVGAKFVERQLGLGIGHTLDESINVQGVTAFFFALYLLMATQDIAVDGWALTMLSKKNRGRGPICNSIGQNIGYFLSFVGFLALNDAESSETLWRPLLGLASKPEQGLVSLDSFIRNMGYFMLATTTVVALIKRETTSLSTPTASTSDVSTRFKLGFSGNNKKADDIDDDKELDAAEIGLRETYHRLWAVCKLPSVQWLFLILLTYRLPTSLSDNVKFLKAVEYGLSKSSTAVRSYFARM